MPSRNNNSGFTLIELLIVISVIAILSAITLSIIKPSAQRDRAEDGIRLANLEKLIQGLESYYGAEGDYPDDADSNGNPIDSATDPLLTYITFWPNGEPSDDTVYSYSVDGSLNAFGVVVILANGTDSFKYRSDWRPPSIQNCTNTNPAEDGC